MTERALQTSWAVCGIAAAAARFVPVPLVDDVIRRRAARLAVVRTLRAHGATYPFDLVEVLWDEPGSDRRGLLRRLRRVPARLLLFPVRKYTAVFGAVRGVPDDVARVVLLARSVDRRLERGELTSPERAAAEASALRHAVDGAMAGMDLRLLTAGLADGLSRSRGLSSAAVAFARRRLAKGTPDDELAAGAPVDEGARQVAEVLRRPEISSLLERFDAEVDERLNRKG